MIPPPALAPPAAEPRSQRRLTMRTRPFDDDAPTLCGFATAAIAREGPGNRRNTQVVG